MATVAQPPQRALNLLFAHQSERNLVNDPPLPITASTKWREPHRKARWWVVSTLSGYSDEQAEASACSPVEFRTNLHHSDLIWWSAPFSCKVHSCSFHCDGLSRTHKHTRFMETPSTCQGQEEHAAFPFVSLCGRWCHWLECPPKHESAVSLSDVCVFACSAAFESSAVYQRLNKRPLNINPCPHHLPAWGAYIYALWRGQKIWLAGVKDQRSTEKNRNYRQNPDHAPSLCIV